MTKILEKVQTFVNDKKSLELKIDHNFKNEVTMRLKSCSNLILASCPNELAELVLFLNQNSIDYNVLGWGANQVIPNDSNAIWLKCHFPFDRSYLDEKRSEYTFPSSVRLSLLTKHAIDHNIRGWEVFTGIPAQLGGAVFMNAGTRLGEIGDLVKKIKKINKQGQIEELELNSKMFSYRSNHFMSAGEVLIEIVLDGCTADPVVGQEIKDYLAKRNATQPLNMFTCGCVYENPTNDAAGRLVEVGGLKGLTQKGIRVSQKHGNFFENFSEGSIEDFYQLSSWVKEEIELQFGVKPVSYTHLTLPTIYSV